jgi:hypothetical protein
MRKQSSGTANSFKEWQIVRREYGESDESLTLCQTRNGFDQMETHFELSDAQFAKLFAAGSLDSALFTHEAHLRLAWIHLKRDGLEEAIAQVSSQLLAYVTGLGARDKFNLTLTVAAVRVVDHFMRKSVAESFADFIAEFPRLKTHFKELLGFHYEVDIFSSLEAKERYLEPDLVGFG